MPAYRPLIPWVNAQRRSLFEIYVRLPMQLFSYSFWETVDGLKHV